MFPAAAMEGDVLTTSQLLPGADGTLPAGTAAFEKRGTAVTVPEWIPRKTAFSATSAPWSAPTPSSVLWLWMPTKWRSRGHEDGGLQEPASAPATSLPSWSPPWTAPAAAPAPTSARPTQQGPGHEALELLEQEAQQEIFNETAQHRHREGHGPADRKVSAQFRQPLLEFSGACGGCGETPMPSWSPSCSATACMWPTPPAAPPSGAAALLHPLHRQQEGPGPRLGELPVRGRRRVRLRHEPGRHPAPRQAD